MKICQISDLHFKEDFTVEGNIIIKKLVGFLNSEKFNDEFDSFKIICCGDITDEGNENVYNSKAKDFFNYIINHVSRKIEFIFVPGNHDLCKGDFKHFNAFISNYGSTINFSTQNVIKYKTDIFDYILINTSYLKQFKYGSVDLDELSEKIDSRRPTIIVMHHTLMSRYPDDVSSIRDAYSFLDIISSKNVLCILHGHTHGFSSIVVGNGCRVIGVGSLFSYEKNCNNQFNIIDITPFGVNNIINYRYNNDFNDFSKEVLFQNQEKNIFKENKISVMYEKVRETVKENGGIHHLYAEVHSEYKSFINDMKINFGEDIKKAKSWLNEDVPCNLYYNHGSHMNVQNKKCTKYILEELNRNSTSNRAIIPLFRFEDVINPNNQYLPGLCSIQFGFTNEHRNVLCCNFHLRSLEVNHFLKINLSEAYILITEIHDQIRSIDKIELNIYAFKAQYKEKFSCFVKPQIDILTAPQMAHLVYTRQIEKITEFLQEKFSMEETVVNISGLESLREMLRLNNILGNEFTCQLDDVIDLMNRLQLEYQKNSNYSSIESFEKQIHDKQDELISYLNSYAQETVV